MTTANAMMMVTLANTSSDLTLTHILCGVGLALGLLGIMIAISNYFLR